MIVVLGDVLTKGSRQQKSIPTKPRSRSVPDVAVLNSQPLTGLLIKYQRLPRGFFWNRFLLALVYIMFQFEIMLSENL